MSFWAAGELGKLAHYDDGVTLNLEVETVVCIDRIHLQYLFKSKLQIIEINDNQMTNVDYSTIQLWYIPGSL